jgi:uncharacterized membrane protein
MTAPLLSCVVDGGHVIVRAERRARKDVLNDMAMTVFLSPIIYFVCRKFCHRALIKACQPFVRNYIAFQTRAVGAIQSS